MSMSKHRRFPWALCALIALIAWFAPATPAEARVRNSGGGEGHNQMVLKVGEVQYMPATNWSSVEVDPAGLVKVVFNRRKGRLTLIPKARGRAVLKFTMNLPHVTGGAKGKITLIIK